MIWVLKGPGPEIPERRGAVPSDLIQVQPSGRNTYEEGLDIARRSTCADVVYVVTAAYHVPRAYLTILKMFRDREMGAVLHVWGTGTVTNLQAQSEARKLADAQAKGHALRWDEV